MVVRSVPTAVPCFESIQNLGPRQPNQFQREQRWIMARITRAYGNYTAKRRKGVASG